MRPLTNWIPRPWAFIICYIFGFLACLVSQLIVSHESGPVAYANFLSAIAFVFTEWWGAALSTIGHGGPNLTNQMLASALVAVFFPVALSPLRSDKWIVRVWSLLMFMILALMTVWWGRLPNI